MKEATFILPLVSEWPFGPARYPVKKIACDACRKDVWLEITPKYLFAADGKAVGINHICTACEARRKARC